MCFFLRQSLRLCNTNRDGRISDGGVTKVIICVISKVHQKCRCADWYSAG
jgi:hypothetical protein